MGLSSVTQSNSAEIQADDDAVRCLLAPAELSERKSLIHTEILSRVSETVETPNGYKLQFVEPDEEFVAALTRWIVAERRCCAFMRFDLAFEPFAGPLWLEISGEAGTKEFLQAVLQQ